MSIFSSMRYLLDDSSKGNIYAALALIPLGLFFDFMDGKVARWRKKSSMMGQELDSLADLVSQPFPPRSPNTKIWHPTPAIFWLAQVDSYEADINFPHHCRSHSASPPPWSRSPSACARPPTTSASGSSSSAG